MSEAQSHSNPLDGVSFEDRARILEHMAAKEQDTLELMGASEAASDFALDQRSMRAARAISAVSRDLHGLERPKGADPGTSSGTFSHRL